MKRTFFGSIYFGLLFTISSCCPAVQCVDSNMIDFYNFGQSDLDKVILLSYKSNTKFATLIDSVITKPGKLTGSEYYSMYLSKGINDKFDYKIKIINTGQSFTLTNFEIKKTTCKDCFPFGRTYYDGLNGYLLNGQPKAGNAIRIYK